MYTLEFEDGTQIKKSHKELINENKVDIKSEPEKLEKIVIKKRKIVSKESDMNEIEEDYEHENEESDEFEVKSITNDVEMDAYIEKGDEDYCVDKDDVVEGEDDNEINDEDDYDGEMKDTDTEFRVDNKKNTKKKKVALASINPKNKEPVKKAPVVPPIKSKQPKESKLRKKLQKLYKRF